MPLPLGEPITTGSPVAMKNHCPNLSAVGGVPADSGVVCGALATGSGIGLAFGDESFAISFLSLLGF